MRAVTYQHYGPPDVLQLQQMEKPKPRDSEILIKIHATTVTSGDCRVRSLNLPTGFGFIGRLVFGISRPRQTVLGTEFSGRVEEVGKAVSKFKIGDQVFGISGIRMGCYADYKCFAETGAAAIKPPTLSHEEAAALSFGGTTALDFLRRAHLQKGEKILVNGASGSVGCAAIQLAKYFGAQVTGVCSGANEALIRGLGADDVIDYNQADFTQNGESYDVIIDMVGTASYSRCKDSLKPGGRLLLVLCGLPSMLKIPWVLLTSDKKIIAGPAEERAEDLSLLAQLVESGDFKPVIDRCYPIEQIAEAHRYVDSGHKKGNVVIILDKEK